MPQQPEQMRRIGIIMPAAADDSAFEALVGTFLQALALVDWTIGRNVRIDIRWAATAAEIRRHTAELVALGPDVILATGNATVWPLLQETRTVPRGTRWAAALSLAWHGQASRRPAYPRIVSTGFGSSSYGDVTIRSRIRSAGGSSVLREEP